FFLQHWRMPVGEEWIWVATIGIFGLLGQVFMTLAFQQAETNLIAPFKYMELVYALLLGLVFLEEEYSFLALIGMTLIVLGMVLNVYSKNRSRKDSAP
ncbi:MAG: EamA family transporter, partial [Bacteroidota bacterium]